MEERIYYVKPSIGEREYQLVNRAVMEGWGRNSNFFVELFENKFAEKIGVTFAIATSSCTGAIELGLKAIGISVGDEVIMADTNWVATMAPIVHLGAVPVFVDIDGDSWCIDPAKVEEKITTKTKAIIATHLYGNLCDIEQLKLIAKRNNIALIEDAAEALGSYYFGKHAGTLADFGVFSFHGSKTLTTGEGGILVTNDASLAQRVRQLNNHGRSAGMEKTFVPAEIGYKFKMSNLQAALGIAQLERFDELIRRKQVILEKYRNGLSHHPEISINLKQSGCVSGAWMPNVTFSIESKVTREKLLIEFESANIDARVFFWPLSSLNLVANTSRDTPIAYTVAERSINLPSYHDMTETEINRVLEVLDKVLENNRGL